MVKLSSARVRRSAILAWALPVFTAIIVIATAASFLYYWEPTRIVWKTWRAKSPYLYERINPKFLKTDPAKLIRIRTADDATRIRDAVIGAIWGTEGPPRAKLPLKLEKNVALVTVSRLRLDLLAGMDNLSGIDRLLIPVDKFYRAAVYHLRPVKPNGKLVLYHNGHGKTGTFSDQKRLIATLIGEGYDVLAFNLYNNGDNAFVPVYLPRHGWYSVWGWLTLDLNDRPLRFHADPVIIGLNHVLKAGKYSRVDMIGFSAGAWVTVLMAAVEPRIQGSYSIAGTYPLYLVSGETPESPRPHYYRPLLQAANYLEMFVLATLGEDRRQMQIFNRYDACCFNNTKGKLYEPAVQKTVARSTAGEFDVVIDETHTRHAISPFALGVIRRDMIRRDMIRQDGARRDGGG